MIGIHDRLGSFSDRWIAYCKEHSIPFCRLNCLDSDIIQRAKKLKAVLWHWPHTDPASLLVAKSVIIALERAGVAVFPSSATCLHYDDKIAQKYLLEAIEAPLVPTWTFTNKKDALDWIRYTTWPKVWKLRSGAGSTNVRLVRTRREAEALCAKAFAKGFAASPGYLSDLRSRVRRLSAGHNFWAKVRRAPFNLVKVLKLRSQINYERGYVYFQEYLSGNEYDTRITVVGGRAFGFMRRNRPGDFRASGSGSILYDDKIDLRCVAIAHKVALQLDSQSIAFDFLFNKRGEPEIVEVSYAFLSDAVRACQGYWDRALIWYSGQCWPEDEMLRGVIQKLGQANPVNE